MRRGVQRTAQTLARVSYDLDSGPRRARLTVGSQKTARQARRALEQLRGRLNQMDVLGGGARALAEVVSGGASDDACAEDHGVGHVGVTEVQRAGGKHGAAGTRGTVVMVGVYEVR
jgi:hypothetical protein